MLGTTVLLGLTKRPAPLPVRRPPLVEGAVRLCFATSRLAAVHKLFRAG